jgi:acyl carrier protein
VILHPKPTWASFALQSCKVLQIDKVSPDDTFAALACDSLAAIELATRLEELHAVPLDAYELLAAPTLGDACKSWVRGSI